MALDRSNRYPGRFENPTTASPQGAFKNRTSPTAEDGSYFEADWANDWDGFFARILNVAGVTPNGTVDNGTSSQLYTALMTATPGRLLNVRTLTSSAIYTPTTGTKAIKVTLVGAVVAVVVVRLRRPRLLSPVVAVVPVQLLSHGLLLRHHRIP